MSIDDLHKECQNLELDYNQAQSILYCTEFPREKRFEIFIALYDATLKNDPNLSFKVFREAYCATDNIYTQVKGNSFSFDLKFFLESIVKCNVDFSSLRSDIENKFYMSLKENFMIYRGISQNEYDSRDFGISWSLTKEEAKKYICFGPNKVKDLEGGILSKEINKNDILTTFSVYENMTDKEPKNEIIYINQGSKPNYEKMTEPC